MCSQAWCRLTESMQGMMAALSLSWGHHTHAQHEAEGAVHMALSQPAGLRVLPWKMGYHSHLQSANYGC